jgi:predicted ATPase/class 3 adenylate cyclase
VSLPSGTVTFLFTDIERSTETVAAMGNEAYAEALDEHRQRLRDAFTAHGGHEVGTEGDSFFVAFTRAHDAVESAADGQRALDGQALRVRMGIHTGEVLVREDDYVGHDVHKAKRISDAAHGGQILLSQATAELVRDSVGLLDLGPHALKDLGEPQRIFQVTAEGLASGFPPLRSLESFTHNLPPQRTTFVGRHPEIDELCTLLEDHRLVTLTGVGGCGKTRLAIQVGAEVLGDFTHGVFFVDLAQLADSDVIPGAIASALGSPATIDVGMGPRGPAGEHFLDLLSARHCLVILDNCEHLLDACAETADAILERCPQVTLLATSREALDVEGEQSWRVPSLSIPKDGDAHASEAVSLFKARAAAARADFELTPQNVEAVAEICRRLDGIPLAIEFAASRVAHLSPQEIADRLGDMFKLLTGGRRRRVQRQQTLQSVLDWSFELLPDPERVCLRRLAVFQASFTIDAAEGICADDAVAKSAVLELVGSLVAKSLVSTEDHGGTTRYRLIETVRLYSSEKLRDAGEADACRTRHRDWFQERLAQLPWPELYFSLPLRDALEADSANFRAALEWSEAEERFDLVLAMAARLNRLWTDVANEEEGLRWLTAKRPEDLDLSVEERVAALSTAGLLTTVLQLPGAADLYDRAIKAAGEHKSIVIVQALANRAVQVAILSRFNDDAKAAAEARGQIEAAMELTGGLPEATRMVNGQRGVLEWVLGDARAALEAFAAQATGAPDDSPHLMLATAAHIAGDNARAKDSAMRGMDWATSTPWSARFLPSLAVALAGAGDLAGARDLLLGELARFERTGGMSGDLEAIVVGFAALAFLSGDPARASRLLGWVRSRTFDAGLVLPSPPGYALYDHYVGLVRQTLDRDEARRCLAEGRAMSQDLAIALAREGTDG